MKKIIPAVLLIISVALAGHAGGMDMSDMNMGMDMDMSQDSTDQTPAILAVMKRKFETAAKPLTVDPVAVDGNWAIAGWEQQGRGGRVLLSKNHSGWEAVIAGGDSLRDAITLEKAGVPSHVASSLVAKLSDAEGRLDPQRITLLSSFIGSVPLGGTERPGEGHGDHAGHAK